MKYTCLRRILPFIFLLSGFSVFAQTGDLYITVLNLDLSNDFLTPAAYSTVTLIGQSYKKKIELDMDCSLIAKKVPCGEVSISVKQHRSSNNKKEFIGTICVHPGINAVYVQVEADGQILVNGKELRDHAIAVEPELIHVDAGDVYTSGLFMFTQIRPNDFALDALEKMKGVKIDNDRIIVDNSNFRTSWNDNIWTAWLEE